MRRLFASVVGLVGCIITAGICSTAHAQAGTEPAPKSPGVEAPKTPPPAETPKAAPSGPKVRPGEELEEIIVTAQKRAENLQDVPESLVTVNGETFGQLRAGGQDIQVMSARVPSLTIESSFGRTFPRFYIRGLGNTDFDLNASQPVSMILDDVVLENPTLKGFPIFDLDHVEVLRGPQGTLFGRNTPAGIVKFDSKKPSFDTDAYGRLTYGEWNFVGVEGAGGGAIIGDTLAARASILFERRDDWVKNTFEPHKRDLEGYRDIAGRVQFLLKPFEGASALLNVHAHQLNGTARVFRANIIQQGTGGFVPGFDIGKVSQDGQNEQTVKQLGGALTLRYDFGPMAVTSVTGYETIDVYSRGDIDGGYGAVFAPPSGPGVIPFPSETADGLPNAHQLTEELRIATNDWKAVNFQAGVFYFNELLNIDSFDYNTLGGGVEDMYANQRQVTTAFGAFGTVTANVGDVAEALSGLKLSAGLRYNDDSKDFWAERHSPTVLPRITAKPSDSFVSWDANASYEAVKNINVFARVAQGHRAPSIQGRILFADTISIAKTEDVLSYEGGLKTEVLDRRARINLAGFYYKVNDQQLTAVGGTANVNTLLNAKKSVGYGFEADTEFLPLPKLLVTAGLSYNHTEIEDPNLEIAACGSPCTVLDKPVPGRPGVYFIDGNPLPHAPEWIADVTARYDVSLTENGELFFFTDWAYRSRIYFFLYRSKEFQDGHMLEGSVRIGYSYDGGRAEVAAFARNITNDRSLVGGIDFNNLTGFVNEPRFWGLEATLRL